MIKSAVFFVLNKFPRIKAQIKLTMVKRGWHYDPYMEYDEVQVNLNLSPNRYNYQSRICYEKLIKLKARSQK